MPGVLIQLAASGPQDIYLTGNPQITFFKVVYKRYSNFAIEAIEHSYKGNAQLGKLISIELERSGDLLSRVYLEIEWTDLSAVSAWRLGHQIIDYAEVEIGGKIIDKQYGEWMDIWSQLTMSSMEIKKLSRLLNGNIISNNGGSKTYTPLQFWFCRNPGLALPLIALQYNDVKINIKFNENYVLEDPSVNNQYMYSSANTTNIKDIKIFCDYIFLDTDERRMFSKLPHEYLIEQVQYSNEFPINGSINNLIELNFNHPVKELIMRLKRNAQDGETVIHPYDYWGVTTFVNYEIDLLNNLVLQINGQDRFKKREGNYFRCVQPFQHHTGGYKQKGSKSLIADPNTGTYLREPFGGFYVYSFALKPEEHQPSGMCNFSRIDNSVLYLNANTQANTIKVWAINYNVLRIMSGMGGLLYSD